MPITENHSFSQLLDKQMKYDVDNDLQKIFNEFDKDGNGALDVNEIPSFLNKLNDVLKNVKKVMKEDELLNLPSDEQISAFTKAVDKNGDGLITFDEFVEWYISINKEQVERLLNKLSVVVSMDESAQKEEREKIMGSLKLTIPEEEIARVFKSCDTNGNGVIELDELPDFLNEVHELIVKEQLIAKENVKKPTQNDLDQFLSIVDSNKDHQITLDEFRRWYVTKLHDIVIQIADETLSTLQETIDVASENASAQAKLDHKKKKCIIS